MKQLKDLDLTNVGFTGEGLKTLALDYLYTGPKSLETLTVNSNKFYDEEKAFIFGQGLLCCKSLKELHMRRMRINVDIMN